MKNILITGTTSGIGEYLKEKLKTPHTIIGVGRKETTSGDGRYFQGDLKDKKFLEEISEKIDPIDYLILNAGIGYFGRFENIGEAQHQEIIETNLISPILLSHLLLNKKKIRKGIIFIGSICSKKSMKYGASYAASKFGLRGFAMQLKNELKGLDIHIIHPKIVDTNFHKNSDIEITGKYKETSLESIYKAIESIIHGKEKRFEIDL